MDIPDELLGVFSATVNEHDDSYTITIPEREITKGDIERGESYRIAVLGPVDHPNSENEASAVQNPQEEQARQTQQEPPVEEGDRHTVEIEGIGDQGDGIARIERGYVLIVPDTQKRDRVTVEITNVAPNVAFAEVVERKPYYE
jgi:predicted RNA-binding protein with TRAM domain